MFQTAGKVASGDVAGTAVVIDEGSIDDIADRIWPLIDDPDLRRRYGAAGVPFTDRVFGADAMTARLAGLYRQETP